MPNRPVLPAERLLQSPSAGFFPLRGRRTKLLPAASGLCCGRVRTDREKIGWERIVYKLRFEYW